MAATTRNYRAVTGKPSLSPQPALTGSHSAFLGRVRARYAPLVTPAQPRDPISTPTTILAEAILLQGGESCPLPVPG